MKLEEIEESYSKLSTQIAVHSRNGLAVDSASQALGKVMAELGGASPSLHAASALLDDAYVEFGKCLSAAKRRYRWTYQCGYTYQLFLVAAVCALVALLPEVSTAKLDFVPAHAAWYGALGGIFYAMWWVQGEAGRGRLRSAWNVRVLVAPVFGAISGALAYALWSLGLATLQTDAGADLQNNAASLGKILALVGGYRWGWVHNRLTGLAN